LWDINPRYISSVLTSSVARVGWYAALVAKTWGRISVVNFDLGHGSDCGGELQSQNLQEHTSHNAGNF